MKTRPGAERTAGRSAPQCLLERLAALFGAGLLALNYPLLALFSRDGRLLGVPLLYVYLLLAWAALIIAIALLMRPHRRGQSRTGARRSPEPRSVD